MTPENAITPLLARGGQNYAPVDPILKLRDGEKKHESSLQKAIKEKYDAYMKHESRTWDELISMGQLVSLFISGQQLLRRKPYGPGYYIRPIGNDDTYRQSAMNLMGFYAQVNISKMMASNPNVTIQPGDDSPQATASAQCARPAIDYYESQFYTAKFKWKEALYALTNGIYIHCVRWNPYAGGPTAQRKNVEQQETQIGDGYGECAECQHSGPGADFQNPELPYGGECPECHSHAVEVVAPQKQMLSRITQGDQMQFGEPEIRTFPFPACRWDLSKDAEDSSWFIYRQRISLGAIKMILGDAMLPDSQSSDDKGLDVLHSLAYQGQAFQGMSMADPHKRSHDRKPTVAEFWMSPEDYADVMLEGGKTVSGQEIPKGRMSDSFKEPVIAVGLNDMSLLIGLYAERHKDLIVSGQWLRESDSGAGRGMQDTAAVQKRFNSGDGLLWQGMAASATPAVLYDPRILKNDAAGYLFKPGQNIELQLNMLPTNMRLQDAFYQGNPGQVSQQAVTYIQSFMRDMFQLSSLVTEFTDGLIGVDNRTATGAQITAALANSLFGPMLLVNGGARVRIAEILVELLKNHSPVARFFPGKTKGGGKRVAGSDLSGPMIFELTQDSQLPTTPFSRQTDIRALIEAVGGVEGLLMLKKSEPAMFREWMARFNVKTEAEDSDVVSTICLGRLEQMKEMLKAGVVDSQQLIDELRPPVSAVEPKQPEKQEWWSNWLDLPEGLEADQILREAAAKMYWLHMNNDTQKRMPQSANEGLIAGVGQAAAMAPSAMGQMAMQQQQPDTSQQDAEMEAQQAEKDRGADMLTEGAWIEHDDKQKDKEIASQERIAKMTVEGKKEQAKITAAAQAKARAAQAKKAKAA